MAILIDNTPKEDGRKSLKAQVSDINDARESLRAQNSILNDRADYYKNNTNVEESFAKFKDAIDTLSQNIKEKAASNNKAEKESAKAIQAFLANLGYTEKKLNQLSQTYKETEAVFKNITEDRNVTGRKFLETVQSLDEVTEAMGDAYSIVEALNKSHLKLNKTLQKSLENEAAINKARRQESQEGRTAAKNKYENAEKVAGESKFKAVVNEMNNFANNLKGLIDTLNINRLANELAPTSKQQIQAEIQTTYGLTAHEFEKFKSDLYDQIDTSIYSVDEVNNAIGTLNTTALGNTQTATKYFNDIIRGQKVLGISSEAQQQLLKLGNITGRNELAFYQDTVAKFLNSNLGLNKKQLDELVQLNSTLTMQAADLGIATEEFEKMNMIESGAMEKTATGFGSKFTQMESTLLANTNTTASLLGMDSGELSERLARGESLIDIIRNSGAGAKAAMNVLANGSTAEQTRMYEHAKEAWGVDANTWSVLRVIAQNGEELDKNLLTATESANDDTQEALDELTKKQTESLTGLQKAINFAGNWINEKIPWSIEATVKSISVGVFAILATLQAFGNLSQIFQMFGGGGSGTGGGLLGKLGKTGLGGKIGGWLGKTAYSTSAGSVTNGALLGGTASILGGAIWGGIDAYNGVKKADELYGEGHKVGAGISGFFGGSNVYSDKNGNVSTGKTVGMSTLSGAGKGALIGAGIGSIIPGVGTAVGAAIGGVAGAIGGAISGFWKSDKAKEQQETLREIEENTNETAKNTSSAIGTLGVVYRYRGADNYSSLGSGAPTGGSYVGSILSTVARGNGYGIGMPEGIHVNSPYGSRNPIKLSNGTVSGTFHNGIDLRASEGTPLYSNVSGSVSMNLTEKSGCNIVGVTDSNGYTHLYAHMMEKSPLKVGTPVTRGQFVGYAGKTGGVTGAHLHYSVVKPGKTSTYWQQGSVIDPTPFVTSTIFNGDASSIISNANMASLAADSAYKESDKQIIKLDSIGEISGPIVGSITDLKQTIIDLSEKTDRNEKILNMLTNKSAPSPIV